MTALDLFAAATPRTPAAVEAFARPFARRLERFAWTTVAFVALATLLCVIVMRSEIVTSSEAAWGIVVIYGLLPGWALGGPVRRDADVAMDLVRRGTAYRARIISEKRASLLLSRRWWLERARWWSLRTTGRRVRVEWMQDGRSIQGDVMVDWNGAKPDLSNLVVLRTQKTGRFGVVFGTQRLELGYWLHVPRQDSEVCRAAA